MVTARAYDPVTGYYTSSTKSQYIPITQVTAITWANIGTVNGSPSYGGFGATPASRSRWRPRRRT